jgi:hypothetical protein
MGSLEGTRREDKAGGVQFSAGCLELEATLGVRFDRPDLDSLAERGSEAGGIACQQGDDLVARHEAVGIVPLVRVTRELDGPVRSLRP